MGKTALYFSIGSNEMLEKILGAGDNLSILQISTRTVIVFIYTLILIRIAGRRSFGLRAPIDNIIIILLGALLSRAVLGASPFLGTLLAGFILAVLHRIVGILCLKNQMLDNLFKGNKIPLYKNGKIIEHNMLRSLTNDQDLMEAVRLRIHVDSLDQIEAIYMEQNGEISPILKLNTHDPRRPSGKAP